MSRNYNWTRWCFVVVLHLHNKKQLCNYNVKEFDTSAHRIMFYYDYDLSYEKRKKKIMNKLIFQIDWCSTILRGALYNEQSFVECRSIRKNISICLEWREWAMGNSFGRCSPNFSSQTSSDHYFCFSSIKTKEMTLNLLWLRYHNKPGPDSNELFLSSGKRAMVYCIFYCESHKRGALTQHTCVLSTINPFNVINTAENNSRSIWNDPERIKNMQRMRESKGVKRFWANEKLHSSRQIPWTHV